MTERTRSCPVCGAAYAPRDPTCATCGIELGLPRLGPASGTLASPGARALGAILDGLVVNVAALLLVLVAPGDLAPVLVWIGIAGYDIGAHAIWGRTVGKVVVGTRCESLDGDVPGFRRAALRWLVPAAPVVVATVWTGVSLLAVPWGIAVFAPIFGAERRGLHDRAAGTRVVRV